MITYFRLRFLVSVSFRASASSISNNISRTAQSLIMSRGGGQRALALQGNDEGTARLPREGERRGRDYRTSGGGQREQHQQQPQERALPHRQSAGRVRDRHYRDWGALHADGPGSREAAELQSDGDRREPPWRRRLSSQSDTFIHCASLPFY